MRGSLVFGLSEINDIHESLWSLCNIAMYQTLVIQTTVAAVAFASIYILLLSY